MAFITYKKFHDQESADSFAEVLTENGIEFEMDYDRDSLDSTLSGDKHFTEVYSLQIRPEDFYNVDAIIIKSSEKELEAVTTDHYLYEFTDEELFDLLSKPDEWSAFDYQLAQKILKERGKQVNPEIIDLLKTQRIKTLAKPEEPQKVWKYAGYFFALIGGIIGVFIGWHMSTYKKTLPNGQQVYGYTKEDRMHGRIIWILGSIMFVIVLFMRLSDGRY